MGFLAPKTPKVPKPVPPANPPSSPIDMKDKPVTDWAFAPGSLISTSASGLRRKANTQRTSLIGG
jgi:hypothetical protein